MVRNLHQSKNKNLISKVKLMDILAVRHNLMEKKKCLFKSLFGRSNNNHNCTDVNRKLKSFYLK